MEFHIHRKNYYDEDQILFEGKKDSVTIDFGHIYAFVGCNGIGKSTLIRQICQDNDTSLCTFAHNLLDDYNGYSSFSRFLLSDEDLNRPQKEPSVFYLPVDRSSNARGLGSESFISDIASNFMSTGESLTNTVAPCFDIIQKELPRLRGKEIYVLLDDLDVGVSLDVIADERRVIDAMARDLEANGTRYAICIAANNYELARNLECISCADLSPVSFSTYDEYRDFVLSTRTWKNFRDTRNAEERKKRILREEQERVAEEAARDARHAKRMAALKEKD